MGRGGKACPGPNKGMGEVSGRIVDHASWHWQCMIRGGGSGSGEVKEREEVARRV